MLILKENGGIEEETFRRIINNPKRLKQFVKDNPKYLRIHMGKDFLNAEGIAEERGWIYFTSQGLDPDNEKVNQIHSKDVKHRLYLTVDASLRAKVSKNIIEKCNEKGLPYNFKVHTNFLKRKENQQSDTIVIYLSEEQQVLEYVNLINGMIQEDTEIREHIHKPSPHLGIVNDFIGYGFEPKVEGERTSYSKILKASISREKCLQLKKKILEGLSGDDEFFWGRKFEATKTMPPDELAKLKLESPEICRDLMQKPTKDFSYYERLKKLFSTYLRLRQMNIDELKEIRYQISKNLVKKCPKIPKNNNLGIDVDEILWDLGIDEDLDNDER